MRDICYQVAGWGCRIYKTQSIERFPICNSVQDKSNVIVKQQSPVM